MTGHRRTRRRWVGSCAALLLAVVALKVLSAVLLSHQGTSAYADGDFSKGADAFGRLETVNVIEPWRAHFNRGTSRYMAGDLDGAEASLREAWERADGNCEVLTNLVLTIETQGDRLADGDPDAATARYEEARDLAGDECPVADDAERRDPPVVLDEARRRLDAKLAESTAPDTTNGDEPTDSSTTTTTVPAPAPADTPAELSTEQLDQLQEINDLGAVTNEQRRTDNDDAERPDTGAW